MDKKRIRCRRSNPYSVSGGQRTGGRLEAGLDAAEIRWVGVVPNEVVCEVPAELSLPE